MKASDTLRTKIGSLLRKPTALRFKVSHSALIRASALSIVLVIALAVRLLPIRWGYYLSEFDPFFQYRLTKYIAENGFLSWLYWRDSMSWYPWGRNIPATAFPGLAMTAAAMYKVLRLLGVPLVSQPTLDPLLSDPVYNLCIIFPAIMGTATCLVTYLVGRELGGEAVGVFAALFLALDPSYIGRTSLGFFDDETVGIFTILLFVLFFVRSLDKNRPPKTGFVYAVAAGLSLGYLCASWGAARYPIAMTAIFALVLLTVRRYSPRLLLSYGITFFLGLLLTAAVPKLGTKFLLQIEVVPVYGVFLLLCIAEVNRRMTTFRSRLIVFALFLVLGGALFAFLWSRGMIGQLGGKFLVVLNPFLREESPIVESVAEHRPSAWGTFYYNFGLGIFFVPVGLFFATVMATNLSIFMIIYGLTSVFFASSMVRLNIIMSPVVCLLWGLALVRLLRPFTLFLKEPARTTGRKKRLGAVLGKEVSAGILMMVFALFALTFVVGTDFFAGPRAEGPRVYAQAYAPTTIASASLSVKPSSTASDWINTLTWMRENLPPSPRRPGEPGTVVASWWDYGYWITAVANRTSLADNATFNMTQIKQIGKMLMSNETEAIKILRKFHATHVLVFTTFDTNGGIAMAGGDEGKWEWMAKIPGLDSKSFGNLTLGLDWKDKNGNGGYDQGESFANSKGQDTVLYKLMAYGREMTVYGYSNIKLQHFEKAYFSEAPSQNPGSAQHAVAPGTQYVALVCLYEVKYPT